MLHCFHALNTIVKVVNEWIKWNVYLLYVPDCKFQLCFVNRQRHQQKQAAGRNFQWLPQISPQKNFSHVTNKHCSSLINLFQILFKKYQVYIHHNCRDHSKSWDISENPYHISTLVIKSYHEI